MGLRARYSSNDIRIIYFLCLRNKFILLHGFKKKKNYTPKKELETARKRMLDYKNREGIK